MHRRRKNVAIGKGAGISYSNGASAATGDVAIGNGAEVLITMLARAVV